jgi:CBS domain-containing protein
METLLQLSQRPPVVVDPADSVFQALQVMSQNRVGAVGVVRDEKLIGVFTERDLMERVVLRSRDPKKTSIKEVMTSPVESMRASDDPEEALGRMLGKHIRHLPVTDDHSRILGMLSIRHLLQNQLEKAKNEAESLEAYLSADGPGG